MKIKKDKYLRERGGTAKIINVSCSKCGKLIFVYQKDGPGWLKRCYINRIISPNSYQTLAKNKDLKETSQLKPLVCECGFIMGTPIKHKDGRLAFHLIRGNFVRGTNKQLNKQTHN
jgi:hypothetical protein